MFKSSENLRLAADMRALQRVAAPWREARTTWFDGTPESIEARLAATERVLTHARGGVTTAHMALEREAAAARSELLDAKHRLLTDFLDDGARAFKGSKRVAAGAGLTGGDIWHDHAAEEGYYSEDDDEDVCGDPFDEGCRESLEDNEGYDGYCGNCADRLEAKHHWGAKEERGLRECINCGGALSGEEDDDKESECLTCGMSAHHKGVDWRRKSHRTAGGIDTDHLVPTSSDASLRHRDDKENNRYTLQHPGEGYAPGSRALVNHDSTELMSADGMHHWASHPEPPDGECLNCGAPLEGDALLDYDECPHCGAHPRLADGAEFAWMKGHPVTKLRPNPFARGSSLRTAGDGPGNVVDDEFARQHGLDPETGRPLPTPGAGWYAEIDPEDRPGYGEDGERDECQVCGEGIVDYGGGWEHPDGYLSSYGDHEALPYGDEDDGDPVAPREARLLTAGDGYEDVANRDHPNYQEYLRRRQGARLPFDSARLAAGQPGYEPSHGFPIAEGDEVHFIGQGGHPDKRNIGRVVEHPAMGPDINEDGIEEDPDALVPYHDVALVDWGDDIWDLENVDDIVPNQHLNDFLRRFRRPRRAHRTAAGHIGMDWRYTGGGEDDGQSGHDATTEVGDLLQTHAEHPTEPSPKGGGWRRVRHDLPPVGWGYGIWFNEPPEDGDYYGSDHWQNGGDRDGNLVWQGNNGDKLYPTHEEAKAAAEAHYYSLDHANRRRSQYRDHDGGHDSGVDYEGLINGPRDDLDDDFGDIFGKQSMRRTASGLDDLTQRRALHIVRGWMGRYLGQGQDEDVDVPVGRDAYRNGSGLMLHPAWEPTWLDPMSGEMQAEPARPAILHEGHPGWADDATFDDDLAEQLRGIGVEASNWYGNTLTLHPHHEFQVPEHARRTSSARTAAEDEFIDCPHCHAESYAHDWRGGSSCPVCGGHNQELDDLRRDDYYSDHSDDDHYDI